MVRLTSITTKSGDRGTTGLGDGTRVPKTHVRIEALGAIDELNAVLGVVLTTPVAEPYAEWLRQVQNDLFDMGGALCFPPGSEMPEEKAQELFQAKQRERVDDWLEQVHPLLSPLENFILPGGGAASAQLHWARTVCRRVERRVLQLAEVEFVPVEMGIYLNRLSDLLFQLSRVLEDPQQPMPLWRPAGA